MSLTVKEIFYKQTGTCPYCKASIKAKDIWDLDIENNIFEFHECPICHKRWYLKEKPSLLSRFSPEPLPEPPPAPKPEPKPVHKPVTVPKPMLQSVELSGIEDTNDTTEEDIIGEEEKRVNDNSESDGELLREYTFSKEWSQSYIIELEKTESKGEKFDMGFFTVKFNSEAENTVRKKYSISKETKLTKTEKVTVTVPPRKKELIIIKWKRIWQHGKIKGKAKFSGNTIKEIEVPFKRIIDVTFDIQNIDLK